MAIVQASLAEEILTRQERAVIRSIYRAAQLKEALVELKKTIAAITSESASSPLSGNTVPVSNNNIASNLEKYLADSIESVLVSIKVPALSPTRQEKTSTPAAKL